MNEQISGFDGKITKFTARYRRSENDEHCGDCVMFNRDGTCDLVAGRIRREDICDYFQPEEEQ